MKLMKTPPHIFSTCWKDGRSLSVQQTHIPVIEPFGRFGLFFLDESRPLGEDSGNSHGRMWRLMSCVPAIRAEGKESIKTEDKGNVACNTALCCSVRRRWCFISEKQLSFVLFFCTKLWLLVIVVEERKYIKINKYLYSRAIYTYVEREGVEFSLHYIYLKAMCNC